MLCFSGPGRKRKIYRRNERNSDIAQPHADRRPDAFIGVRMILYSLIRFLMKIGITHISKYTVIVICALIIGSCRKEKLALNPDYIGVWSGGEHCPERIQINADGSGEYWVGGGSECGQGRRTDDEIETNGKSFKLQNIKFEIITPPTDMDTITANCYCGFEVYVTKYMELKKGFLHNNDQSKYYKMGAKME